MKTTKECRGCKKPILTGRIDKLFCDDRCRNGYNQGKEYRKAYYEDNKADIKEKARQYRIDNYAKKVLVDAKYRAKRDGKKFNIEECDIVVPEYCPLLNIKIKHGKTLGNNNPSLDRIDTAKGYVKGNVWIISNKANRLKSNLTVEQLKLFCSVLLDKVS